MPRCATRPAPRGEGVAPSICIEVWARIGARPSKKRGASLLPVVAARAEGDEVAEVEGCAAGRDGLDVVHLEPAGRAAAGAAVAVAAEGGCARALPFRCGADENAGFARGAALP
jgi:hypothetical protein